MSKLAKLVDSQKAQLTGEHKAPMPDSGQDRQTSNDNIPITVRKMQAQAQRWHNHNRHIEKLM